MDKTPEQLSDQITISSENESKVLTIIVKDSTPELAANIANKTAEIFKKEIPLLMNVDNINILSAAKVSENVSPIKPNKLLNIVIGVAIGIALGIGLAMLLEKLDTTIKDEKDVEQILSLPIIGLVSSIPIEKKKRRYKKPYKVRGKENTLVEK